MARIGIHGLVQSAAHYAEAIPILDVIVNRIENAINGQLDSSNLADNAVITSKITDGAVTSAKTADGVGQTTSTTYVGDGTTANRVVALTFTPRYVLILRTDATFITFESIAVLGVTWFWSRSSTGAQAASATDFQGIVANGIKLGSSATGTSNAAGVTYSLVAYR